MQVVSTLCDLCHTMGDDTPAVETITVTLNKRATELDICEPHQAQIEVRFQDLFEVGRRPGNLALALPNGKAGKNKKDTRPDEFACDRCTRTFDTMQGLATHRTRTHKLQSQSKDAQRFRARAASNGHTAELPNGLTHEEAMRLLDQGVCIFNQDHDHFANRSLVGSHIRGQHGVSLTSLGLSKRETPLAG